MVEEKRTFTSAWYAACIIYKDAFKEGEGPSVKNIIKIIIKRKEPKNDLLKSRSNFLLC